MPLDTDIGYVNADNNNELEPKVTPAANKKTQTPDNCTDNDLNSVINYIKEDREKINENEQAIIDINDQIYVYTYYGLTIKEDATESGSIVVENTTAVDVDLTIGQTDLFAGSVEIIPNENIAILAGQIKAVDVQGLVTVIQGELINERTANVPEVPTKTSDLNNDGDNGTDQFITANDLPTNTSDLNNDGDGNFPFATIDQIPTIPTVPTKTSDLTNDGPDGLNPFITANDLPTPLTQEIYDENDFDYFLDSSVSNFAISLVKTGRLVSFNVVFDTNDQNPNNQLFFRLPFPAFRFTDKVNKHRFVSELSTGDLSGGDFEVGGIGQCQFNLDIPVPTGETARININYSYYTN